MRRDRLGVYTVWVPLGLCEVVLVGVFVGLAGIVCVFVALTLALTCSSYISIEL